MEEKEREGSSEQEELEPYFVRFAAARQAKPKKIIDADPVLVLAPSAVDAKRIAKSIRVGGLRKHKVLEVEPVGKEEFKEKAKEYLQEGRNLPPRIIEYAGLQDFVRELRK